MNIRHQSCLARVVPARDLFAKCTFLCRLLALFWLMSVCTAPAQEQDTKYLRVHNLIQQADALNSSGQTAQALAKYREAQIGLESVRTSYPGWNAKAVAFRSKYLADKVAALTATLAKAAETNAAPADSAPKPGAETKSPPSASTFQLKLVQPGSEPRKALRLHPKAGDKQNLTITTKLAMEMKMGEAESQSIKMPTTTMPIDLTIKSVAPEGDIIYDFVIGEVTITDEPGVLPQVAEAIKTSYSGLKGHTAQGKISQRGINKVEFKLPAAVNPQTRQALDQMKDLFSNTSVPLPEEAVGAGAKWEVKRQIKSQGMTIDQTATYELVSSDGEQAAVKATIKQQAANQKIENPAMPGMKVDVTKMTGTGTADMKLDLAQVMPRDVTAALKSDSSMAMNMGGQKQAMTAKTDVNVRMESK